MGSLWFVGWSASPRVEGRPVVLTPARRELLAYLGQAESWAAALGLIDGSLLGLLPEAARPLDGDDLATPRPPFGHPELLRDRALAADNAYTHLLGLRAQLERAEVPSVLTGLHAAGVSSRITCDWRRRCSTTWARQLSRRSRLWGIWPRRPENRSQPSVRPSMPRRGNERRTACPRRAVTAHG